MNDTRKGAGRPRSPHNQEFPLASLKFWRLPWTCIFLPTSWQPQNLTSFQSYPSPACNFLWGNSKRRSSGVGLLFESQFYYSPWLCISYPNFLSLCFSTCKVETIISTFQGCWKLYGIIYVKYLVSCQVHYRQSIYSILVSPFFTCFPGWEVVTQLYQSGKHIQLQIKNQNKKTIIKILIIFVDLSICSPVFEEWVKVITN